MFGWPSLLHTSPPHVGPCWSVRLFTPTCAAATVQGYLLQNQLVALGTMERSCQTLWPGLMRSTETVGWLLYVPATCQCISGTHLHNCTCCHTEIEVADQTFYLTQPQYTDTVPTSPNADPIMPGAWQGSHSSANF